MCTCFLCTTLIVIIWDRSGINLSIYLSRSWTRHASLDLVVAVVWEMLKVSKCIMLPQVKKGYVEAVSLNKFRTLNAA